MRPLDDLASLLAFFPWLFPAFSFLLGACIGSFLNVCIYRIPAGKSVVHPGSHCACGQPIAWFDNLPILSWGVLRGRARCCGRKFSVRYPAVELLTAVLFLLCARRFAPAPALAMMAFISLLIAASFIDLDHMIIPDRFSVGGAIVGVVVSLLVPALHGEAQEFFLFASLRSGVDALLGMLVGSAVIYWIRLLGEIALKKEAMGEGDINLLGCIGAFLGWQGAVFSVFGGAVLGLFATAVWLLFQRNADDAVPVPDPATDTPSEAVEPAGLMGLPVPFGPLLSAASVLYLLWLQPWVSAYFANIAVELAAP